MLFQVDTAQKLRAVWHLLTPEQQQELFDDGTCDLATRSTNNASLDWRIYDGGVALSSYVRAYGEFIAEAEPWVQVSLDAQLTQDIAMLVMSREPAVVAALLQVNRGKMPPILPPIVPEPAQPEPVHPAEPAPEPTPEEPQPETPPTNESSAD